jgi:hypothetical protein
VEQPIESDYGEKYFEMDCVWVDPASTIQPAVWRCSQWAATDLINGYLYLELENDTNLWFCGRDLTLSTGIDLYDNLISYLTRGRYDCLHITEDRQKENEFDWEWDHGTHLLQIIWRPEDDTHKMISIVIQNGEYDEIIKSTVYYKILSDN